MFSSPHHHWRLPEQLSYFPWQRETIIYLLIHHPLERSLLVREVQQKQMILSYMIGIRKVVHTYMYPWLLSINGGPSRKISFCCMCFLRV